MANKKPSKIKVIIKSVVGITILLALLFFPAGTLNWPEAWLLLLLYFVATGGIFIWMKKNDPELLRERMSTKKEVKSWDKKIMLAYTICLMIMLSVTGLDAVRFHWSNVSVAWKIIGFFGFIPAYLLGLWAMTENTYVSDMVRIQQDRGHRVCTTGPYKYIRHPMYAGIIIFIFCLPIALGSLFAYIPGTIIVFLFVLRTALEDKTLLEELHGYKEYAEKVKYKLVPGVW